MRIACRYVLVLGSVVGLTLGAPVALASIDAPVATGALTLLADEAAAQSFCIAGLVCTSSDNDGGDATASGGNGGDGGISTIHDVGTAEADASNLVIVDDITTGNADARDVIVDARGTTAPVVLAVAGSFVDTGVDVFAPGGSGQAGTTGGNMLSSEASGGSGGGATSIGGTGLG